MTQLDGKKIWLRDYRPPDYWIDKVKLSIQLDASRTIVTSKLDVRRSIFAESGAPFFLNGEGLELLSVHLDGEALSANRYRIDDVGMTISDPPEAFSLEVKNAISPETNTALSGLYISNGMFCTQCEAEGFRRITYFPDRPDVLAKYSVRIEAEKIAFPVLLSNGNKTAAGELDGKRHFVEWSDPHPKPSYLFALVGGDLSCIEDSFVTRSGREVSLKVFVQRQNRDRCDYTLDALKRAMKWDEDVFGREYDLDVFMIVAVDHFNFGAMENKGLNIFNSAYVLASPTTATDADYEAIESIVAHEYFHNWSGNRVTCRDWFQLCLKEGFTVFRDQEFSADMRSRGVQRIKDVRRLWARQFPEDAGPLAHPVRPESFVEIDNFYTATVYEKGAELCRMIKVLLGDAAFRKGSDLYFNRHDGEAATVEDFISAMEDAGGRSLKQFSRWYSDAGTPILSADANISGGRLTLRLAQETKATPEQSEKPPREIPVALALIGAESGDVLEECVVTLNEASKEFVFGPFEERVIPSLLRGFSAPVRLRQDLNLHDRLAILKNETDLFSRWAVSEQLWRELCLEFSNPSPSADREANLQAFTEALADNLSGSMTDAAFAAELLKMPSEAELSDHVEEWDPETIATGRTHVRKRVADTLRPLLLDIFNDLNDRRPFSPGAEDAAQRGLKNAALSLLVAAGEEGPALGQIEIATNMTDEAAATAAIATSDSPSRKAVLERFVTRWGNDALVVNKWLGWVAMGPAATAIKDVSATLEHAAFDLGVPNKVRALIGGFTMNNPTGFHRPDGAGYRFFADRILQIDPKNPQLAARLMTALENWRRLEPGRRKLAKDVIQRIASAPNLSPNVSEMASRLINS